ncbi:hypothetical protein M408DRAFT_326102 [Serendipita vermifera MAFF 305830]|uniref:D-aminoacyl-tRNA deacylase n=1 Tax=Serendipita vermifera MAFF 305830 TaxID=933852 RepID=A0A0C2X5F7_SERVB|nr:hypothetical protein M408DRAFT_326102 [Serendipita vermifera MAFF 305830]
MRAIIQRVSSASVTVGAEVVSKINEGLMVLVGITTDDTPQDIDIITQKVLNIKAFPDAATDGQWKSSVMDRGGEVLCVSQFTLYAKLNKNKPDFHKSMPAASSSSMYTTFLQRMDESYDPAKIKDGKFGAMMSVALTNEGPVTFIVDSRSEGSEAASSSASPNSRSGINTPRDSPQPTVSAAQRAAEKALRKEAWEAAKKQKSQVKENTSEEPHPSQDAAV